MGRPTFDAMPQAPLESRPFAPTLVASVNRLRIESKPLRTVLRWQMIVTAICAIGFGVWQGFNGAVAALMGGAVPAIAGGAYSLIVSRAKVGPAGAALRLMFRAEAVKILLIVILSWFVLTTFRDISKGGYFVAFAISVFTFSMAIAVREPYK
jgi:ATP synthase protein I